MQYRKKNFYSEGAQTLEGAARVVVAPLVQVFKPSWTWTLPATPLQKLGSFSSQTPTSEPADPGGRGHSFRVRPAFSLGGWGESAGAGYQYPRVLNKTWCWLRLVLLCSVCPWHVL